MPFSLKKKKNNRDIYCQTNLIFSRARLARAHCIFFMSMETPKNCFCSLTVSSTQGQKKAVRIMHAKNKAVGGTIWGWGFTVSQWYVLSKNETNRTVQTH